MAKKAPALTNTRLANPREWSRTLDLEKFARSVDSGREQEALWLLDDGLAPSAYLLGEALCAAASRGQDLLCERMLRMGAPSMRSEESPKLWIVSDSWRSPAQLTASRFAAPALALLAGHGALALKLESATGVSILGEGTPLEAARLLAASLRQDGKAMVLERCSTQMRAEDLASVANWLCVAGKIDDALACLDAAPALEKARVARAMVSPLCAYSSADSLSEIALIALEQALDLSEGRLEKSLAPWSYKDQFTLSRSWGGSFGGKKTRREECALAAAERSYGWSMSRVGKSYAAWPRVSAGLCGNAKALALMENFPCHSDERQSLSAMAEATQRALACPLEHRGLPAMFAGQCYGEDLGRIGLYPSAWSDMALAYHEKFVMAKTSSDAVRESKKSKLRAQAMNPPAGSSRRSNRL